MKSGWYRGRAIGLGVALTLVTVVTAQAQEDTTRARSDRRISVRKDAGTAGVTRRESPGEVMLSAERARIDSLEALASTYSTRISTLESSNTSLTSRTEAAERALAALQDSLRAVHGEINSAKAEVAALTARTNAIADSVYRLNTRFNAFRNGSIFGNSGFYMGVGSGANFTIGTLNDIGYKEGLNVVVPVGYNKRGSIIGFRGELGLQTFDGRSTAPFSNPDPKLYTAVGMLALHFPMNSAKTHNFYLTGGGGAFVFDDIGAGSGLDDRLDATSASATATSTKTVAKWGVTGAAGFEFHVLGATSLFIQTGLTNVFANKGTIAGTDRGSNLAWAPLVAGIQIR
jgi:hypothetical protein